MASATAQTLRAQILIAITFFCARVIAGRRAALLSLASFIGLWAHGGWLGPLIVQPRSSSELVQAPGSPTGFAFPSVFAFNHISMIAFLAVLSAVKTPGKLRQTIMLIRSSLLVAGWNARVDPAAHQPSDVAIS